MSRRSRCYAAAAASALLVGCSSPAGEEGDVARGAPPGSTAETPTTPTAPPAKYVSFVPESTPGEAPALVTFQNTTSLAMTVWMNQITFLAVPSGGNAGPEVAASADVRADTVAGQHQEDSGLCVKLRIDRYEGPPALAPGASYLLDLTFIDRVTGYAAALSEVKPSLSFVGLRMKIEDAKASFQRPSALRVDLVDGDRAVEIESYDATRTFYAFARSQTKRTQRIVFVDGAGSAFESSEPLSLADAPGYTAVVGDAPAPGAAAVTRLSAR